RGDGERQHGVAGVVAEEQADGGDHEHGDGRDPGDAADGHDHIVADRLDDRPGGGESPAGVPYAPYGRTGDLALAARESAARRGDAWRPRVAGFGAGRS